MHMSSKRALDGFYVIDQQAGSEWGCSEEKIAALEGAVRDTQALAFMASTVLAEKDSEFSDAYIFWFGEDNTKAATKNSIKTLNYDPVQDFLKAPGARNRVDDMRIDNLSPTGLTYMCAAADDSMCAGGMAAAAHQHGAGGLSGHSIVLCDRFFGANSQQDMLRTWKDTRRLSASSGFWLLHEVQHLGAIVSDGRRCVDVPDPNETDGSGCYDANCCSRLKGADKIRNAQNMAFFALEVMADPQSGQGIVDLDNYTPKQHKLSCPDHLFEQSVGTVFEETYRVSVAFSLKATGACCIFGTPIQQSSAPIVIRTSVQQPGAAIILSTSVQQASATTVLGAPAQLQGSCLHHQATCSSELLFRRFILLLVLYSPANH
ncbi:uncharacterized protein N0V96_011330 [Colletotrichum fioriniae]|uniref:uncharacterized protein n=1 Tax=Colletotrichum fioriniae TaxID=710243 RepID=UPI0032DAABD1|nr:hypothetical protein N0V96_011330 [Colletotrichum fioriniae]